MYSQFMMHGQKKNIKTYDKEKKRRDQENTT